MDELAGWDGIKKEEITDGLRVVKGEDIFPDNLTVDVLEGSLRIYFFFKLLANTKLRTGIKIRANAC